MPVYAYRVKTEDGRPLEGVLEAASEKEAIEQLRAKGYWVLRLRLAPAKVPWPQMLYNAWVAPWRERVRPAAMADFFEQWAAGLNAGMTSFRVLDVLSTEATHPRLRKICAEIKGEAQRGVPLSNLLGRYPNTFPQLVVAMVKAGEVGGRLEDVAREMARYYRWEDEVRRNLRARTLYTKLQLAVFFLVLFILRVVVPYLQTKTWQVGGFLRPLALLGLGLVGIWALFRLLLQFPSLAMGYDALKLSLPIVGGVTRRLALARFARALAFLYRSGLSMAEATAQAAQVMGNRYLEARLMPLLRRLEKGEALSKVLEETRVFPRLILEMVRTGEETGEMDALLEKVADRYNSEAEAAMTTTLIALPVVLLLLMGALVFFFVAQFYLGFYSGLFQMAGE